MWARGAQGRRAILRQRCKGTIEQRAHETHRIRNDAGVVWCERCGAFSSRLARNLLKPCMGAPGSDAQRNRWRRLHSGLAATTANYLISERTLARQPEEPRDDSDAAPSSQQLATPTIGEPAVYRQLMNRRARARGLREHPAIGEEDRGFVGRYLRLPGGPQSAGAASTSRATSTLQPRTDVPSNGGTSDYSAARSSDHTEVTNSEDGRSGTAPAIAIRRRLNRKTDPSVLDEPQDSIAVAHVTSDPLTSPLCQPSSSDPWTRRIGTVAISALASSAPCAICNAACRTRCRGCQKRICAHCAQLRRSCVTTPTAIT